jgi:hypothetical protein
MEYRERIKFYDHWPQLFGFFDHGFFELFRKHSFLQWELQIFFKKKKKSATLFRRQAGNQSCPIGIQGLFSSEWKKIWLTKLSIKDLNIWAKSGRWWLVPLILATQEPEIRRDHGSKPAWANSSADPVLKTPIKKKSSWRRSRCGPWVQTPLLQKKLFK